MQFQRRCQLLRLFSHPTQNMHIGTDSRDRSGVCQEAINMVVVVEQFTRIQHSWGR